MRNFSRRKKDVNNALNIIFSFLFFRIYIQGVPSFLINQKKDLKMAS